MKKYSFKGIFQKILSGLSEVLKRYPIAVAFSAVASVFGLILINIDNPTEETERLLVSILMAMVLGVLISLVVKTIFEHNSSKLKIRTFTWIVFGCSIVLYIAYLYGSLEGMELFQIVRFAVLSLAFFVLFMTAVFRKNTKYQEAFSTLVGWRLAITAVYTLIIWGGISLILFTIERLLNVYIAEEAYMDTIILILGFFLPVFFLSGVTAKDESIEPTDIYKFFRILVVYVIAPLLVAYSVVFYIYALRILFSWDWPEGMVANMVLWYALIGTVAMYFIHGMDKPGKWAAVFGKWFPRIIILPIVLLFISLGIRINAYGITANRYLLGITGIWMLGCAVYMSIVNYKKRCTRVITVSLAVLAILSVAGPWNAINVGRVSQTNCLEKILVDNSILQSDGSIVKVTTLDEETKGEISDKINYLENFYDFKGVDYLPKGFKTSDMNELFGFGYTYYYPGEGERGLENHIMINENTLGSIVDLAGYDYMWDSELRTEATTNTPKGELSFGLGRNPKNTVLIINIDDEEEFNVVLDGYINDIVTTWNDKENSITYSDTTFDELTDRLNIRIIFTGVEVYPDNTKNEIGWFRFYVLVKTR